MKAKSIHMKIDWTPEDRARHLAIRNKFKNRHPGPDELLASGECTELVSHAIHLELMGVLSRLKKARKRAGMSLADVAKRSDIDKAALSRLENGQNINPTIDTLWRYALAVGKHIVWSLKDAPSADGANNGRPRKSTRKRTKKA